MVAKFLSKSGYVATTLLYKTEERLMQIHNLCLPEIITILGKIDSERKITFHQGNTGLKKQIKFLKQQNIELIIGITALTIGLKV